MVGIGILAYMGPGGGPAVVPTGRRGGEKERAASSDEFAAAKPSAPALAGKKEAMPLELARGDKRTGGQDADAARAKAAEVNGDWQGEGQTELAAAPQHEVAADALRASKGGAEAVAAGPAATGGGGQMTARLEAARNKADIQVQTAMNRVALGEAPLEDLKTAANVDNLRQISNNLVIETDAPDQANRDLERLFGANGWQPVAEAQAAQQAVASAPAGAAAEQTVAQAALPTGGYYFLAHTDGEETWVVVADWDALSRFSSQLANDDRLTVGEASTPPFRDIRALQQEVRSRYPAYQRFAWAEGHERKDVSGAAGLAYSAKAIPEMGPPEEAPAPTAPAPSAAPAPAAAPTVQAGVAMKSVNGPAEAEQVQTAEAVAEPAPAEPRLGAPAKEAPAPVAEKTLTDEDKRNLLAARDRLLEADESAKQEEGYFAPPAEEQTVLVIRVQRTADAARAAETEVMERQAAPAAESGQ